MELGNYRNWIFDMDGTLTHPVHDFEHIRSQIGIPSGVPILEAIEDMSPEQARRTHRQLHDLEMELAALATPQPGVFELLERLVDDGRRIGILTRNSEEIGYETLRAAGLSQFFPDKFVIGRETCAPKPQPDGVFHLLDLWSADPAETVIVGDYLYDIQAGHEAGIATVHFDSDGLFPWPQFTRHRVVRMAELLDRI